LLALGICFFTCAFFLLFARVAVWFLALAFGFWFLRFGLAVGFWFLISALRLVLGLIGLAWPGLGYGNANCV
jgi:hypothetical protein